MSEFNQDIENLLNAYDSNWEDYLILREQFIDKYKFSLDKLEDHLLPYSKEMIQKIRDEKMQLVTAEEFVKLHQESLTAIRNNDKLQEQLNSRDKTLTEIRQKIDEHNQIYDLDVDTAVLLEEIDGLALDALEKLEGGEDED